ncbi:GIY-YIG nuclease family protein [Neptunicella sp. SCSIO 80796]|uniref:GIY-YIG nuclease family protein n=1 Tax=Neptunicella plasticusilytica TaxID=3117012 RepID=UPI003A4D9859
MSGWHLYIIRNRLGQLYTGISTDPARRFEEHQSGGNKAAKALKGKGPLQQVYCAQVGDRSQATKAEMAVKKLTRAQKLALIGGLIALPLTESEADRTK